MRLSILLFFCFWGVPLTRISAQTKDANPLVEFSQQKQSTDGMLQKILNGEFSPELYHLSSTDNGATQLEKQRINCAYAGCESLHERLNAGAISIGTYFDAQRRLADARLEFHSAPSEKIDVLTEHLKAAKEVEKAFETRVAMGICPIAELAQVAYYRIDIELRIFRLQESLNQPAEKQK